MIYLITLAFGCFLLGSLIAYVLWIKVRTVMFQAELQLIRIELDAAMKAKGLTQDKNYMALRVFIHEIVENADFFSIPILWLCIRLGLASRKTTTPATSLSGVSIVKRLADFINAEGSPDEVKEATTRVLLRLFLHLALTPSMILLWILLAISGRTEKLSKQLVALRNDPRDIEPLVSYLT